MPWWAWLITGAIAFFAVEVVLFLWYLHSNRIIFRQTPTIVRDAIRVRPLTLRERLNGWLRRRKKQ